MPDIIVEVGGDTIATLGMRGVSGDLGPLVPPSTRTVWVGDTGEVQPTRKGQGMQCCYYKIILLYYC